jgi:hypothetical protein
MATHAFWVIVDGTTPTAFRAKQRDVLLPTLKQLQRTQPAVALRWFDRGQLWDSPIAARDALKARRQTRSDRGPGWRPGGNHVDPRERYQLTRDQKRAKFKRLRGRPPLGAGKPGSPGPWKPRWDAGKPDSQKAARPEKPGGWKAAKPQGHRPWKSGGPARSGGGSRPFNAGSRSRNRRPVPRGPKRDR